MLSDIVIQAANSEDNCIPFSDLSQNYLQAINDYLRSEYKVNLSYIINHMIYDSIPYYPNIMVPNAKNCNSNLNPIIIIGTETYLDSTFNNQGDFAAGWGINNNNNINTILINEQQAENTARPIIIINNGTYYVKSCDAGLVSTGVVSGHGGNGGSGGSGGGGGNKVDYRKIFFEGFQINYRYEKTGDSEYAINYILVKNNYYVEVENNYTLKKVNKNDIGTPISLHIPVLEFIQGSPKVYYHLYGYTYEYDWYATKKPLAIAYGHVFNCRMTKSNEYYQVLDLPLENISNYQYKQIDGKGYIKLERIDP